MKTRFLIYAICTLIQGHENSRFLCQEHTVQEINYIRAEYINGNETNSLAAEQFYGGRRASLHYGYHAVPERAALKSITLPVPIQIQRNKSTVVANLDTWSFFNKPGTRHNEG